MSFDRRLREKVNLKADFMGLTREIDHVKHQKMLPLSEKWVVTISTQYGCSMNCRFCDVPKVGKGVNATYDNLRCRAGILGYLYPRMKARVADRKFSDAFFRL